MQKRTKLFINRYVIYLLTLNVIHILLGRISNYIYNPNSARFNQNLLDMAWIFSWSYIILNFVMAIVIYTDMRKLNKMNWWIIAITLINKEFGAIICLLHYFKNENDVIQTEKN